MDKEVEKTWDLMVEYNIATDDEINLVTSINGYNMETLNDIIYARTGFRSIDQLMEEV